MNQRQLAAVLFAVVGVFIAASRLPEIVLHLTLLFQWRPAAQEPTGAILATGMLTAAVLVGLGLVGFRDRLAERLFPADGDPLNAPDVQAVALSVLGCYFVVHGIATLRGAVGVNWGALIQIGLGAGLFFGARGLARLWSWSRSA